MAKVKKTHHTAQPSRRHSTLLGFGCIAIGIVLTIGLFVHLAGYSLITFDKPNVLYAGVTTRVITQDNVTPPFIAKYPVTGNRQVDISIRDHIDTIVKPYLVARRGLGDKVKQEQLQIDYSIRFYNKETLSLELYQQKERPEGITDKSNRTLVYDMKSAKQVKAADVIINLPALRDILYDHLRVKYASLLTPADLIHVLDMQLNEFTEVIPYQEVISFTFNPSLSKNPNTSLEIGITKPLLNGIVADKYYTIPKDLAGKQPDINDVIAIMPSRDEPVNPSGKRLALTFDDGPGVETPRLLDALKKYRAHATFFVIGNLVDKHNVIIKRQIAEGNEIGNHSWSHADLTMLPAAAIDSQLQNTQTVIGQATGGYVPRLMRPPYGAINNTVSAHAGSLSPTLWTVDTLDWRDRNTDVILNRIMAGASDRGIILLHDIHPSSVDAAILAIQRLRADGWQLVTVSQLN